MSIKGNLRLLAVCALLAASAGCGAARSPVGGAEQGERDRRTGAVQSLTRDDLKNQTVARVEELLEGRVAGVHVVRLPNGDFSLRIRGINSLNASTEPLVVIDGMPVAWGASGALASLNPRDVERIDVLKDAGETAFYGVRGANGVILIHTKRGH